MIAVAARDAFASGGGTVAIETARRAEGEVHLVVDTIPPAGLALPPVTVTPLGMALKRWNPRARAVQRLRHFAQLAAFSFFARRRLAAHERAGAVTLDHNCEAAGGDIVVLHNVFTAQYRADRRSRLRRLPQLLNPVFGFRILRERHVLRRRATLMVIAVSEQTAQEARSLGGRLPEIRVIHSGVDTERYHPVDDAERARLRRELGLGEGRILLFAGHEFERKRLDLVIAALALLPSDVELWAIGGRGSSRAAYERIAAEHGVARRVHFAGTVSNAEAFFQAADVFALPSDYETWGLVSVEALACGLPVVMTPTGCAELVLGNGRAGSVVDYTPGSIADAVARILADPTRHAEMRREARRVAAEHSWASVAEQYNAVIDEVRARKAARLSPR